MQVSYDKDVDKILKQATCKKTVKEKIVFLKNYSYFCCAETDLSMIAMATENKMTMEAELKTFVKAWNHLNE